MLINLPDYPAHEQDRSDEQATQNGYLVVEALFPNRGPISMASVMLYTEDQGGIQMHKVLLTGINGRTEPVCLPNINKGASCQDPQGKPYANFTIRVDYDGCYTNVLKNAWVQPGKTTVHTSVMTLLPFGVKNAPGVEKVFQVPPPPSDAK